MDGQGFTRRGSLFAGMAFAATPLVARGQARRAVTYPNGIGGFMPIMDTQYAEDGAVDYEAMANQVRFINRTGARLMVYGQLEDALSADERQRAMETVMAAARG